MALAFDKEINTDFLAQNVHLLLFRLGKQTFALPIEHIVQIIPMLTLTPVPQLQQIVQGVANIHGEVVPVLNARRFLGMPELPLELDTPIILCNIQQHPLGLIVDEVLDVLTVLDTQITATQQVLPDALNTTHSVSGIIYQADRSILLLNPQFLLNPKQMRTLSQVIDALPPVPVSALPTEEEAEEDVEDEPTAASALVVQELLDIPVVVPDPPASVPDMAAVVPMVQDEEPTAEASAPVEVPSAAETQAEEPVVAGTELPVEETKLPEPPAAMSSESTAAPAPKKPRARKKRPENLSEQFASLAANLPPTDGSAAEQASDANDNQQEGSA